ncbi:hypothetical protein [Nostoc sp.]
MHLESLTVRRLATTQRQLLQRIAQVKPTLREAAPTAWQLLETLLAFA